ncbi:MAG: dihydroorotase [Nitrospinota bacterium]
MGKTGESIIIKNGRVCDPASGIDKQADVLIEEGKIAEVGNNIAAKKARVIDAAGLVVSPGFIDLHVHLREPGYEYKETIATGAISAAAGGFTAVCAMANTDPVNDNGTVTRMIIRKAEKAGAARVYPIGAVTKGLKGKELAEIGGMKEAGIVAISDDGRCVMDAGLLRNAMEYASMFGLTLIEHCEDEHLARGGIINEGRVAAQYGVKAIPAIAEGSIAERDISIACYIGRPIHLAHISVKETVEAVRAAKAKGIKVTCEVTPHHFALNESVMESLDATYKMNPPLRMEEDVEALKEGIRDGTIDAIATDHAPHAKWEKELELDTAPFGVVGLETALGVSMQLVHDKLIPLSRLIELLSKRPAEIFNLPGGSLKKGSPADISIFDMNKEWAVDVESFLSKGRNSPFAGMNLKGKNILTLVGGGVVYNPMNL